MPVCIICDCKYSRDGGVMITVCSECLSVPTAPDSFHLKHGILVPNQDHATWQTSEANRIKAKQSKEMAA